MQRTSWPVVLCAFAFIGSLILNVHAQQARSVSEGVYSGAQAIRGQAIYKAECAECHGNALEGTVGSPLAGDSFLSDWSARPLSAFVDKIQKTMPFSAPGSLSRSQSTDLTAYILQFDKFPAGQRDLTEDALARIEFPGLARRANAPPSIASLAGTSLPPPQGNLAELMRAIAFPNSNIVFNLQVKDPGTQPKKQPGNSLDYVDWGSTVYQGWLAVDQAAVAITETAPLLLTPGRRCQNGRPVPVDRADWKQYVAALEEVGQRAYRESKARNYAAFVDVAEKLNDACANCHKVYRDKGGAEGSGGTRCQP
jgi:mono/diheme cytochrome c family protein